MRISGPISISTGSLLLSLFSSQKEMIDETDLLNYNTHTPHQQTKSPTLHVSRTPCVVAERGARTAREGMWLIVLTPSLPAALISHPSSPVFPRPSSSAFFSFPCTTLLPLPSPPCLVRKKKKKKPLNLSLLSSHPFSTSTFSPWDACCPPRRWQPRTADVVRRPHCGAVEGGAVDGKVLGFSSSIRVTLGLRVLLKLRAPPRRPRAPPPQSCAPWSCRQSSRRRCTLPAPTAALH